MNSAPAARRSKAPHGPLERVVRLPHPRGFRSWRSPLAPQPLFRGCLERRARVKTRRLQCLAADAAAHTGELDRRGTRAEEWANGATQHNREPCAAAQHFMVTRAQPVHAASLAHGVPVHNAELDRSNTAFLAEAGHEARAAEAKGIFTFCCVAHGTWHEDRQSNARVERPTTAPSGARTAQNDWRAGRAPKYGASRAARTRC